MVDTALRKKAPAQLSVESKMRLAKRPYARIMLDQEILMSFMGQFVGYGSLSSKVWIIGLEEGGGDDFDEVARRLGAWDRLGRGNTLDLREFHVQAEMPRLFSEGRSAPPLQSYWRRVMLMSNEIYGKRRACEDALRIQQAHVLARSGHHVVPEDVALLELLPLPAPSTMHWHYNQWSQITALISRESYRAAWLDKRIRLLQHLIAGHQPEIVVFLGQSLLPVAPRMGGLLVGEPISADMMLCDEPFLACVPHPQRRGQTDADYIDAGKRFRKLIQKRRTLKNVTN